MQNREKVVRQVRALLEHEKQLNLHKFPVRIDLDSDGSLILEGEVASIAAKKTGLELAASVPGVPGIIDRLRVVPARRMGDGELRDRVRDALLGEPAFVNLALTVHWDRESVTFRQTDGSLRGWIEISIDDGVVTLVGQVGSLSHKCLAGALAWWVPGTRDVVNGLEIRPPQEREDSEISEAVRLVLEKDPLVNGSRITVSTQNSVVTLRGRVANRSEMEMIENDAWCVFWVDKVVNRLETL